MKQSKIIFGRIKHIYSYHSYNINSYIIQVLSTTSEYHIGVRYYQMNPCAAICCVSVNIFQVNGKVFMIAFQISYPELTEGQVKACTPSLRDGVPWRKTQCNISATFFLYFIIVFSKCVVTVMTRCLVLYSDLCSNKKKNNKRYAFKKTRQYSAATWPNNVFLPYAWYKSYLCFCTYTKPRHFDLIC